MQRKEEVWGRGRSGRLALTEDQVKKLWDSVTDLKDEVLLRLAVSTGIRREDIVAILWRDVCIEKGTVTFTEKKKSRTRTVPIGGQLLLAIQKYMRYLDKNQVWLFPGRYDNQHMNGKTAYDKFNNYLKKAGLPGRPFHALRATCVKLAQKKGWSVEQVMELTGDSFRTIKEHYDTPSEEEMNMAAKSRPIE